MSKPTIRVTVRTLGSLKERLLEHSPWIDRRRPSSARVRRRREASTAMVLDYDEQLKTLEEVESLLARTAPTRTS
ncbi:MAG: hypothetical protein HN750_12295 [Gemmatimonadales bacterium]|jgi:hypothetical protein|nr:hypothetical protein [Gemmatimonadales bacterium]